jgi:hypothetical protein
MFLFKDKPKMSKIEFIPRNEIQTREWFCYHLDEFEYSIVESQIPFPDYTLKDGDGNILATEMEYQSVNFINHQHDPKKCDLVICWIHNAALPMPVFELSTRKLYDAQDVSEVDTGMERGDYVQMNRALIKACDKEIKDFREAYLSFVMRAIKIKNESNEQIKKDRSSSVIMPYFKLYGAIRKNGGGDIIDKMYLIEPEELLDLTLGRRHYLV